MLKTRGLSNELLGISREFAKVKADDLMEQFTKVCGGSTEDGQRPQDGSNLGATPGEASGAMPPAQMGKQEALKQFTVDWTERARNGEIDPIVGTR